MSNLTEERRNKLKIAVVLFLISFIFVYGVYLYHKYFTQKNTLLQVNEQAQVIFTQPTLQFFTFKTSVNEYPDSITVHYPYLIIVRPDSFLSEIYNMETQVKEKTINQVLLDYYKGNVVYNKEGYETYYNNKDLGLLCDKAFIQSATEILCITRPDTNSNKLISINLQTFKRNDVYESQNLLTAVYFNNGTTYLGEYNIDAKKAYITVNKATASIGDFVNIIYPMQNNMYAGSFKSVRNNHIESYYQIDLLKDKMTTTTLVKKSSIVFFNQ